MFESPWSGKELIFGIIDECMGKISLLIIIGTENFPANPGSFKPWENFNFIFSFQLDNQINCHYGIWKTTIIMLTKIATSSWKNISLEMTRNILFQHFELSEKPQAPDVFANIFYIKMQLNDIRLQVSLKELPKNKFFWVGSIHK